MKEKHIEQALMKQAKALGGMCIKFVSPSMTGIPDRIVLMPKGCAGFVEVKQAGKKPRLNQTLRIKQLQSLGHKCFIIDDINQIGGVIDEICAT